MKLLFLIILATTLSYSCNSTNPKQKSSENELAYSSDAVKSETLMAVLDLNVNIPKQQLNARLKLLNTADGVINIEEIIIATTEGLRSLPINNLIPFSLGPDKDTSLTLNYNPLNDLKLNKITGMQGNFKPAYIVSIAYKTAGKDSLRTLAIKSQTQKDEYLAYISKYKKQVTGYSFNTKTDFNEKQKKYLETIKDIKQPLFVYLSEQEIAVSGLNFRFKSYYQQDDTLHAELFVVNHADFPVKFIKDALDIVDNGASKTGEAKIITIEKVSGSQQDTSMLEKGDRVYIHFKKYLRLKTPAEEKLTLIISKAFILTGKKPLFCEDVELLPVQF